MFSINNKVHYNKFKLYISVKLNNYSKHKTNDNNNNRNNNKMVKKKNNNSK